MDKDGLIEELTAQVMLMDKEVADWEAALVEAQEKLREVRARREAVATTAHLYQDDAIKVIVDQEPKAVRNRSYIFLQALGRPLHYTALFKFLTEMGVEIGGQDPQKNLIAHLSQDSRFKSFGGGDWGLVEWKNEPPVSSEGEVRKNGGSKNGHADDDRAKVLEIIGKVTAIGADLFLNEQGGLTSSQRARFTPDLLKEITDHRDAIVSYLKTTPPERPPIKTQTG